MALAVLALAVGPGCGGDRSGGPSGQPDEVVNRAPDVTLAAGTARIRINAPAATAQGVVDLVARSGRLSLSDVTLGKPAELVIASGLGYSRRPNEAVWSKIDGTTPAALRGGDPFANLDLVRGTVHILSD